MKVAICPIVKLATPFNWTLKTPSVSSVTPVTRSPLVPTPDNSDPIGIKLEVLATVIVELVFVLITSLLNHEHMINLIFLKNQT